ncbi:WxcM-like domain-containing protein [Nanoarchaeota archaeon]
MDNPLDQYSKPAKQEDTKLSTIYWLHARDSRKGRLWMPIFDQRFPFKFDVKFSYISKFLEKDNVAGNHYHNIKQEILIPLQGSFDFTLEDVQTKEREVIPLNADDHKAIYIKTGISHSVRSKEDTGILLVLASNNSRVDDEVEYEV